MYLHLEMFIVSHLVCCFSGPCSLGLDLTGYALVNITANYPLKVHSTQN